MMKSHERFQRALLIEEPDRTPIFEIGITPPIASRVISRTPVYRNPSVYLKLCSEGKWREAHQKIAQDIIDIHQKLGYDGIRVTELGFYIYSYSYGAVPEGVKPTLVSENVWDIGGVKHQYVPANNVLWPMESIIMRGPEEADRFVREHWSEVSVPDGVLDPVKHVVKGVKGEKLVLADAYGTFPFTGWKGFDRLLIWMYTHPHVVRDCIEFFLRRGIELAKAKIDEGVDGVIEVEDYAHKTGPFMTPSQFKEFVQPALRRYVDEVHKKGAFFVKHLDGNIDAILDGLVATGIDGLQSIEPSANMDIGDVKNRYGDKVCLLGNMDVTYTLVSKTVEDVVKETKKCIDDASPGGGHILCSANSIHVGCRYENVMAMIDTGRRYGLYPAI